MFINDDFPTLDRPIKAYSGRKSLGHLSTSELLIINSAVLIFMAKIDFGKDRQKKNHYFLEFLSENSGSIIF